MDKQRFRKKMANKRPATLTQDIADIRKALGLPQDDFALMLGISKWTLQKWEQGQRKPNGAALSLLIIASKHPRIVMKALYIDK